MKKILLVGILGLYNSFVYGEGLPTIAGVNCDNVKIEVSGVNDKVYIFAKYKTIAEFPNSSREVVLGDFITSNQKKYKFKCPDYEVTYNGNELFVKADNLNRIFKLFKDEAYTKFDSGPFKEVYENKSAIPLYTSGNYKYPNIRVDYVSSGYQINLENLWLVERNFALKEAKSYTDDYRVNELKNAVIAYKVDNKELKPYFFNNTVYPAYEDFNKAEKIEIFHKRNNDENMGVILQKIAINKKEKSISLFKNAVFPYS
ncbi:hypothetical protein IRT38_12100 [Acinetobacter sp. SK-43]|uniref:hypothetical protein n=1 Tax=Acinetobacter sp. SK-43 TaxID=2785295 RepID=UPI00188B7BC5|nr:hypothetical protein [Acinetobacter sp. SK-43]MBF4456099.1 hypothetical protein [Acinetobacter sp. SK-43]